MGITLSTTAEGSVRRSSAVRTIVGVSVETVAGVAWESKRARIGQAHVAPLNSLVLEWRSADLARQVPWFDPDDGGTGARVLVLMETPGPGTVRAGGSGFCSEDNPDGTARTFRALRAAAGLARRDYVRWNVVPWAVHDATGAWTAPTAVDLEDARPALAQLLGALPELRLVVVMGQRALAGYTRHVTLGVPVRALPLLATPHPSQRNTHARAEALLRIGNALACAAQLCGSGGQRGR